MIADERSGAERELAARVIDTLLREDYAGLSRRLRLHDGRRVLDLPADQDTTGLTLRSSATDSWPTTVFGGGQQGPARR